MSVQPQQPQYGQQPAQQPVMLVQQGYAGPRAAVTSSRKKTRHGLHLVITVCTFGCWAPVWAWLTLWHIIGPKAKARTNYYG